MQSAAFPTFAPPLTCSVLLDLGLLCPGASCSPPTIREERAVTRKAVPCSFSGQTMEISWALFISLNPSWKYKKKQTLKTNSTHSLYLGPHNSGHFLRASYVPSTGLGALQTSNLGHLLLSFSWLDFHTQKCSLRVVLHWRIDKKERNLRLPESRSLGRQLLHDSQRLVLTHWGKNSKRGRHGNGWVRGSPGVPEPPLSPKWGHRIGRGRTLAMGMRLKLI